MLKEILLTDDEKDTILGLCQYALEGVKKDPIATKPLLKIVCTRLGLIICKVKGHVPHYNEAYIAEKGGWKRVGPIIMFPDKFIVPDDGKYDFSKDELAFLS